jgi:putative sterol carrier protein
MPETIQEVIGGMPGQFNAEAAKGMNAVYQYDITGDGGTQFYTEIKDGQLTVKEGTHPSPNITITMTAKDYLDLVNGKLNGQMAFMSGKLKIKGDMSLAMKLQNLFRPVA